MPGWLGVIAAAVPALAWAAAEGTPEMPGWVDRVGGALAPLVGSWITREAVLGIRWITACASLIALGLVALADLVLRVLVRRKIQRDEARAGTPESERRTRYWIARSLEAALPPLVWLVWVNGIHAALSVLLIEVTWRDEASLVLATGRWLKSLAILAGEVWLLYRLSRVVERWLGGLATREGSRWDEVILPLAGKSVRLAVPLLGLILALPTLDFSPPVQRVMRDVASLLLIGVVAVVLFRLVQVGEVLLLQRYRLDGGDNLEARKVYTQVRVLGRVGKAIIAVFALASMLMVFDAVRQFGTSILASAGIAGIIVGFAAQRSIATLLAGFQIALTQPIRLDDVVIVENEWGRIEDITLTYVVVRIWDQRRLVVPITHFIEQPFQNWTRNSSDLLGSVFLHVDYTAPLGALREELDRILAASPFWDGKVKVLHVTDARERTLELRILASAPDALATWNLRCEIREKLVTFLQERHPESLPRVRAELSGRTEADPRASE
jgi:small-conductance mechanosensitive channel